MCVSRNEPARNTDRPLTRQKGGRGSRRVWGRKRQAAGLGTRSIHSDRTGETTRPGPFRVFRNKMILAEAAASRHLGSAAGDVRERQVSRHLGSAAGEFGNGRSAATRGAPPGSSGTAGQPPPGERRRGYLGETLFRPVSRSGPAPPRPPWPGRPGRSRRTWIPAKPPRDGWPDDKQRR